MSYFPIVNVDRYDGCYAQMIIPFIVGYLQPRASVPDDELEAWAAEQQALDTRGEHFFSTGRFSFAVSKPS